MYDMCVDVYIYLISFSVIVTVSYTCVVMISLKEFKTAKYISLKFNY